VLIWWLILSEFIYVQYTPSWEADSRSSTLKIPPPPPSIETERSLPCLQNLAPTPYSEQYEFTPFPHVLFPTHAYVFHVIFYFQVSYPEFYQRSPVCVL